MKTKVQALISTAALGLLSSAFVAPQVQLDKHTGYTYTDGKTPLYKEELTEKFVNGTHRKTESQYFDAHDKSITERTMDIADEHGTTLIIKLVYPEKGL